MADLRGVLFDLDGVLYNGDEPISGAQETVAWVREHSIPHLFLTNTTSKPRQALVDKLGSLGVPADLERIWSPLAAARQWLDAQPRGPLALFLRPVAQEEFAEFPCVADKAESGADYVLIGDLGAHWDFAALNRAFRLLHSNSQAKLIALGLTRYWQANDGPALDVAPFVAALECAGDRQAIVLGKPAQGFFDAAAAQLGLAPAELLMIGDDIRADIGGAQRAGLRGALVRTGKFRASDLKRDIQPEAVFESVAELPKRWPNLA